MLYRGYRVVLMVPCFNEELSIRQVIDDFRNVYRDLDIRVFDNASSDNTASIALAAETDVTYVPLKGKGNVVRRMFADIEADIYVLVDGDATYEAKALPMMLDKLIDDRLDMIVGARMVATEERAAAYRRNHEFGNKLLTRSVAYIFGGEFTDMLSGYRVFTRRYVKSFPALSTGFEIETELTVHALELRMPYADVLTVYKARPDGSVSKLSTYKDGLKILLTILKLFVSERPLKFYTCIASFIALLSIALIIPVLLDYVRTGLVPRFPTAILSSALGVCSILSVFSGLILDNVTRGRQESKRLAYLSIPLTPLTNLDK